VARPSNEQMWARLAAQLGDRRWWGWQDRAACRGHDPAFWDTEPSRSREIAQGKRICRECPVQLQCLDWAVVNKEPVGVWGGLGVEERRALW
jgi:WhiB family transcriptional regulator, redox-sensing transcriptional regulator